MGELLKYNSYKLRDTILRKYINSYKAHNKNKRTKAFAKKVMKAILNSYKQLRVR
jgi:hypothetical protein